MAIDFETEKIIDLKHEAPAYLGQSRNGRPVHHSFLIRAVTRGIRGHRLEAVRVGSRWLTSVQAIQRWAEAQTPGVATTPAGAQSRRRQAAERADRELEELGF
jgi:hypothetical protein